MAWVLASALMLSATISRAIVFPNEGRLEAGVGADQQKLDGVGKVMCVDQRLRGITYTATGWVLGSADTVVTVGHALFPGAAPGQPAKILNPRYCMFILYGPDQRVRGYARVRYAMSPWSESHLRYDSSYDVAVLKLDRDMPVTSIPAVQTSSGRAMSSVSLAAFHTGVAETHRVMVTQGPLRPFPAERLSYAAGSMRVTIASHMFSTSAGSTSGSSGGMYYDGRTHAAIGLHVGWICDTAQKRISFDPARCFNYGLRFDAAIAQLVDMAVQDRPIRQRLVDSDGAADGLASAHLDNRAG